MNKLQIYKTPELAILEQNKKLRDYSEIERLTIAKNLVDNLLGDLGVSAKADTNHHVRAIKHIAETLLNYAPEEIEKAFQMYINHEFKLEVYQQLNSVVIGNVLREYEFNKKEKLAEYRRKVAQEKVVPMTKEEESEYTKLAVQKSLNYFIEYREVDKERIYVYDILDSLGKLPTDIGEKNRIKEDAKMICEREQSELKPSTIDEKREFAQILKQIKNGSHSKIITKCKELVLAKFYRNLKGKKLTEFKTEFGL